MRSIAILLLATILLLASLSSTLLAAEPMPEPLRSLLSEPRFKHAHWGMLVVDQSSDEVLLEVNPDQLFVPASTTKLYSVAAALDDLGADYRFQTRIHHTGSRQGDVLVGNLILVASGDLTMGGRSIGDDEIAFTNSDHTYASGGVESELTSADPLAGLNELARQISTAGIAHIQGDVLVDDRLFELASGSGSGPSQLTPIVVNDNVVDLLVEPTVAGQAAKVTVRPSTAAIQVIVEVQTTDANGRLESSLRSLGGGRLQLNGQIPEGHKPILRIHEVPHAAGFARTLFIEALQRAGVQVDAPAVADHPAITLPATLNDLPVVAELRSPPFSEYARLILKVSHNLHASTLPLIIASRHGERTLRDGLRRQREFLQRAGVDVDTISFGGGAGGSRADYVTPRATVQLLKYMTTRADFPLYERALPRLGVDGTLTRSVDEKSPARDKVFAKTGTLAWDNLMNGETLLTSKALAGYLNTRSGRRLLFATFVNNVHLRNGVDARSIGRDLGKLCEIIHESY